MSIVIRYATAADCPRLLELIHELAVYEKAGHEVTVGLEEFIAAGFGPQPVWTAFVALKDEEIAGMALYYIRYSTWKGCRLYLEDFLVTAAERGRGIGKLLFDRVLQEARDKNYNGVNWQVLDWNAPALKFYSRYAAHLDEEWLNASLTKEQLQNGSI